MTTPDHATFDLLARVYDANWTFIDDHGQRCYHLPTTFTAAERQQLVDAGLQPNTFVSLTHAETISQLRTLAATIDLRQAADAFVASLVSRDLAWLTVLPATALGLAMPVHDPDLHWMGGRCQTCRICFYTNRAIDSTQRMVFRHRQGSGWGGEHPLDGVLALQQLVTERRRRSCANCRRPHVMPRPVLPSRRPTSSRSTSAIGAKPCSRPWHLWGCWKRRSIRGC